ncbi:hypothetical protein LZ31DRAFT_599390 [Colletotrichum somersetense]|nr:hypothetical protein LZ31DRAFT_599390 [Colletotrichum somersetense]
MRFRGLFLLIHSLVAAAAAASIQKPPVEQRATDRTPLIDRRPLEGTPYEVSEISSNPPAYRLYNKDYEDGQYALARIKYSQTSLTRRPILDIWAADNIDAKEQYMQLYVLIAILTKQETQIELDRVPYVIFTGGKLREEAINYTFEAGAVLFYHSHHSSASSSQITIYPSTLPLVITTLITTALFARHSLIFFSFCTNGDGPGNMTPTLDGTISWCVGIVVEAGPIFHLDNCEYAKECSAEGAPGTPACDGIPK